MDELTSPEEGTADTASLQPSDGKRPIMRLVGLVFIGIALLLAIYGTVGFLAFQRGQELSLEYARQDQAEQVVKQINLARGDIEDENFARAMSRLEWVLEREPESEDALALHTEAEIGLNARLHPSPIPALTETPNPVETAEPDAELEETANQEAFEDLEVLMDDGEWEDAITAITDFQHDFPDERRGETDEMLYNAYINLGVSLVSGTQIELGLFYFTQAEELGDLPIEVQDQRTWAELYLDGIGYYNVNWETAIFYFRGLCAAAPFYQNACQKLFDAYVAYGDQYASILDWCPAEEWYLEAVRLENDADVVDKRREATTNCLEATPTPQAPITDTISITNTLPTTDTLPSVSPTETVTP